MKLYENKNNNEWNGNNNETDKKKHDEERRVNGNALQESTKKSIIFPS